MFIDSHAHLTSQPLEDEVLTRAKEALVGAVINIAVDESSLTKGFALADKAKDIKIHTACATTPHDVAKDGEHFFPIAEQAAINKKLIAIGETGLDYYYEHSPRELQKVFLRRYLQLAKRSSLPVIIHCRDAFDDFFSIYDEEGKGDLQGVLHCFTGTLDEAKKGLERGMYISFSGIITFPKSEALRQVVEHVPLHRLLIETDAPYLAPVPYRGRTNEPAFVVEVAKQVAVVKNVPFEEVAVQTSKNAKELFDL
jgi:TatD DNase family protein